MTLVNWHFGDLRPNHYGVIYADPPWYFGTFSDKGRDRSAAYDCMSLEAIKALPVADLAAKDCALLMWAIDPMLPEAFEVLSAWGFRYKTVGFYWEKLNADGTPFTGLGYWTRANPEQCLLATRGKPKRLARDVRRLIRAPRRAHSQKPDEVRTRIERLLPGPYCELFARTRPDGWDVFGNQTDRFEVAA
ncbi:N6-adenosine-specific RNA methylase IME4 [Azospirillum agricola]|uniref:MT-A70 family methyltransferase n=1 Tax=Azospirillum agricola TaxID=1720247 RepID=UPI001AE93210|nr:MT-A70 family methyltransferase [Azospirillum agricola]MBP2232514.1 N6-adenosine-specific RNA methylase IME4 [Azospirillum agricola]